MQEICNKKRVIYPCKPVLWQCIETIYVMTSHGNIHLTGGGVLNNRNDRQLVSAILRADNRQVNFYPRKL